MPEKSIFKQNFRILEDMLQKGMNFFRKIILKISNVFFGVTLVQRYLRLVRNSISCLGYQEKKLQIWPRSRRSNGSLKEFGENRLTFVEEFKLINLTNNFHQARKIKKLVQNFARFESIEQFKENIENS